MRTYFTIGTNSKNNTIFRGKVEGTNIKLVTKLLTNGLIPSDKIPLLSSLFDGVQISWDGNKDNNPRFGNNKQIGEKIWENIGLFINEGTKVNILTVVSEENYKNLGEIIDSLYNTYGIGDIVLSLKDSVGKADNELINIDYSLLRKNYIDLWKKYRGYDIDIPLTGTDIHSISNHPCGVSVPNFSISPNGIISSCTLSFNNNDTPSYFDIGRLENGTFILNELKVKNLQALSVLGMEQCNDCFGKWHCRGGCMYANKLEWLGDINPQRCDMIRKIIADKILFIAGFKI
ncbi:SPASM domain-containing protein [Candidatus Gracilibacteria bacterium]|nr:SPASM domain-containing protein [Candidatus Gracilibacteria bacterium]